MHVIVYTPMQTREYGPVEVVGPFDSTDDAQTHLAWRYSNLPWERERNYDAHVVPVENPSEDH